eukprot:PhM_4_TR7060/c0_g1_i1/m.98082
MSDNSDSDTEPPQSPRPDDPIEEVGHNNVPPPTSLPEQPEDEPTTPPTQQQQHNNNNNNNNEMTRVPPLIISSEEEALAREREAHRWEVRKLQVQLAERDKTIAELKLLLRMHLDLQRTSPRRSSRALYFPSSPQL